MCHAVPGEALAQREASDLQWHEDCCSAGMRIFRAIAGYIGVVGFGLLGVACGSGDGSGESDRASGVVSELRSSAEREQPPLTEAARAAASEQTFGFALLQRLEADENLAFSPHSLSAAFAMLSDAAEGQTLGEVEQVLAFGSVDQAFHRSQDALKLGLSARNREAIQSEHTQVDAQILSESNDVWIRDDAPPEPSYLDTLAKYYGVGVHSADFGGDPEGVRLAINDKVATDTHDLIQGLIKQGQITADTVTVLTNALYFKAPWATHFAAPKPGDFHALNGAVKSAQMLATQTSLAYAEGDGFVSVAVPYYGGELEMLLVVPRPAPTSASELAYRAKRSAAWWRHAPQKMSGSRCRSSRSQQTWPPKTC